MHLGGLKAVRLECRRARELRVMKWRCGPFLSSIYNHQLSHSKNVFQGKRKLGPLQILPTGRESTSQSQDSRDKDKEIEAQ